MSDIEVRYAAPAPRRPGEGRGSSFDEVRRSIYTLYRRLSPGIVAEFAANIHPDDVTLQDSEDLLRGTERMAHALVRHLRLPDTRIHVAFTPLPADRVGRVTLGSGPEYFVEIDSDFAQRSWEIGAVLAHEVSHVFLKYHNMRYEDEILTDTTAAYLGVGWPILNTHYTEYGYSQRLGYLGTWEFGYVLARRAVAFAEDPLPLLTGVEAQAAYRGGQVMTGQERVRPPFAAADARSRRQYEKDLARVRRRLDRGTTRPHDAAKGEGYRFSGRSPLKVTFDCPLCSVKVSVPVDTRLKIRCETCHTPLDCDT